MEEKKVEKQEVKDAVVEKKAEARSMQAHAIVPVTDATRGLMESISRLDFQGILELGSQLVKTGFLPDAIKTGAQAAAIILKGAELRIPPMQALQSIHIIRGTPSVAPQLMLGMCHQRIMGFKAERLESTAKVCRWRFTRPGQEPHEETFAIEKAAAMKTKEDGKTIPLTEKFNWRTMPQVMLEWRCISAGLRVYCPDIVTGLYTPEELEPGVKIVNADRGEVELAEADYVVRNSIEAAPSGGTISMSKKPLPAPKPQVEETPTVAEAEPEIDEEPKPETPREPGEDRQADEVMRMLAVLENLTEAQRKIAAKKAGLNPMEENLLASDANVRAMYATLTARK